MAEPNRKPTSRAVLADFDVSTRDGLAAAIVAAVDRYNAHLDDPRGTDDGADAEAPTGDDFNDLCGLILEITHEATQPRG